MTHIQIIGLKKVLQLAIISNGLIFVFSLLLVFVNEPMLSYILIGILFVLILVALYARFDVQKAKYFPTLEESEDENMSPALKKVIYTDYSDLLKPETNKFKNLSIKLNQYVLPLLAFVIIAFTLMNIQNINRFFETNFGWLEGKLFELPILILLVLKNTIDSIKNINYCIDITNYRLKLDGVETE